MKITFLKREIEELIAFSKRPNFRYKHESFLSRFRRFGMLLLLDILILAILTSLFYLIASLGFNEILNNNEVIGLFSKYPLWLLLTLLVLFIPLIEEAFFRFPLKYRRLTINLLVPIILTIIVVYALDIRNSLVKIFISVLCLTILILFVIKNKNVNTLLKRLWSENFNYVFYISTLLFALLHLTNYEYSTELFFLAPILILPQFFGGLLIGYLRIKSGFVWGLVFHMISNLLLILPFSIALSTSFPSLNIETYDYHLVVHKVEAKLNSDDTYTSFSNDSIIIKNIRFKECLSLLITKPENLIKFDDSFQSYGIPILKSNIFLKIEYNNKIHNLEKEAITKSKHNILEELKRAYHFNLIDNGEIIKIEFY